MANDGAPAGAGAGGGGGAPAQLPPSSFDQAMLRMNDVPLIHGEPPGASSSVKINDPSRTQQPPGAHAEALPDPAELAAREELLRSGDDASAQDAAATVPDQIQAKAEADAASVEEWMQWKDSLTLPEPMMDKLISVPWGEKGEVRDVPIAEMKQGYMRMLDHTRKNQAAAATKRQAEAHSQNMNRFLQDLGNPGTLRERLEDIGYGPVLQQAAEAIYAERLQEERYFYDLKKKGASDEALNFMREQLASNRKTKLELRAAKRTEGQYKSQLSARNNSEQQQMEGQQLSNQLAQLRPLAFKRLGLKDDALHNNAFQQQFISILETGGGQGRQLREIVLDAATAAKQMVEEHIANAQNASDQEHQRTSGLGSPMSVQRLPGASPTQGNGVTQARQKRLGLNDFDAEMARLNGGAR